jgi:hypothetical protein
LNDYDFMVTFKNVVLFGLFVDDSVLGFGGKWLYTCLVCVVVTKVASKFVISSEFVYV